MLDEFPDLCELRRDGDGRVTGSPQEGGSYQPVRRIRHSATICHFPVRHVLIGRIAAGSDRGRTG